VGEEEDEDGRKAALYGSKSLFGVKVMGRQQPTAQQSKLRQAVRPRQATTGKAAAPPKESQALA
jgi:hypothetical protein